MTIDINYFPSQAGTWDEYFKKKIGLQKRDLLLKPMRDELYQTNTNDPHAFPTKIIKNPPVPKPTHQTLAQMTADWYGVSLEDVE